MEGKNMEEIKNQSEDEIILKDLLGKRVIIQALQPLIYSGELFMNTQSYLILQNAKVIGSKHTVETPLLIIKKPFQHIHPEEIEGEIKIQSEDEMILKDFIGKEIVILGPHSIIYTGKLFMNTQTYLVLQNAKIMGKQTIETPLLIIKKPLQHIHLAPEKLPEQPQQELELRDGLFPLDKIVIPKAFTPPRREKVQEVIDYYKKYGELDKPVTVRKKDLLLTDGYKRYAAAKELGLAEIPVKFV